MKKGSIIPSAIGSVLFASAITMLIPTLASATFQDVSIPLHASQVTKPHASQVTQPTTKHLSAQQMKVTKGAYGSVCNGDCTNGINACGPSAAYGGSFCYSYYYHHSVCVGGSIFSYSTCNNTMTLTCYDYVYRQGGCQGQNLGTVQHPYSCCGW